MAIDLYECLYLSESQAPRVDRERGIIHNVKVLGWKSANGREYLPAGVNAALYEGRAVNADHVPPGKSRSSRDTIGVLEGAEVKPDGVYAKRLRLLNPRGEYEQRLLAAAEIAPKLFGLSHTARGRERPGTGGSVIESVDSVQSVDVVSEPATVTGLYESRGGNMATSKLKDLREYLRYKRPGYARALAEMAESGVMGPDTQLPAPEPEMPAGQTETGDHTRAILDAAKACIDDASLAGPEKVKKIKQLLGMVDGGGSETPETEAETPSESESGEKEMEKTESLQRELGQLRSREMLRELADEAGIKLPKSLLENLRSDLGREDARKIVAEIKSVTTPPAKAGAQTPRSAAVVTESRDDKSSVPTDPKEFARWVQGAR